MGPPPIRALGRKDWLQPGAEAVAAPRSVERGRQEVCSVGPGAVLEVSCRYYIDIDKADMYTYATSTSVYLCIYMDLDGSTWIYMYLYVYI